MCIRDEDHRIWTGVNEVMIEAVFVDAQITRWHITLFSRKPKKKKKEEEKQSSLNRNFENTVGL